MQMRIVSPSQLSLTVVVRILNVRYSKGIGYSDIILTEKGERKEERKKDGR